MPGLLLDSLAAHRDAMVDLTCQLVGIPSENPPGRCYAETIGLLVRHLRELGFTGTRVEGDCILSFIGGGDRTLYFSGHYDVVPAQSPAQFEPSVQGANLFGRGSSDMKSGLAAMIYAAKALKDCNVPPAGRKCAQVYALTAAELLRV
jgi:succinyl-diaminopimelate desuccinylase